jgi:hypothetical protein
MNFRSAAVHAPLDSRPALSALTPLTRVRWTAPHCRRAGCNLGPL